MNAAHRSRFSARQLAVGLAGYCCFINLYAPQAILPLLAKEFGAGVAEISTIMTASTLAVALTAPFTGAVADILGRKRVIVIAMLLLGVPTLMLAFSPSLHAMAFWRFVQGLVLPAVFTFMTHVAPAGVAVMPDISHYLSFVLALFLAFGLCFELPVVLVILVALGVVTPAQLAGSRRYAIVGSFVVAAVLTPPDVLSQTMLALPMCLLYELGILGARSLTRRAPAEPVSPADG